MPIFPRLLPINPLVPRHIAKVAHLSKGLREAQGSKILRFLKKSMQKLGPPTVQGGISL